jgi:hypothetical protein
LRSRRYHNGVPNPPHVFFNHAVTLNFEVHPGTGHEGQEGNRLIPLPFL